MLSQQSKFHHKIRIHIFIVVTATIKRRPKYTHLVLLNITIFPDLLHVGWYTILNLWELLWVAALPLA